MYVCQLPANVRDNIRAALIASGIEGADLQDAMDSRVCDLADAIDVTPYL